MRQGLSQKGIFIVFLIQKRFQKEFREYQECMHSHETTNMIRQGFFGKTSQHQERCNEQKNIFGTKDLYFHPTVSSSASSFESHNVSIIMFSKNYTKQNQQDPVSSTYSL